MATSVGKIALGVGCGILLALAAVMATCVACVGFSASRVAREMQDADLAKSKLRLVPGWQFASGEYSSEITGSVVNESDREFKSVMIEFNIYDRSGSQVGTASDTVSNLEPGKTWRFKASVYEKSAARAEFKGFSAY